ncbi:PilZ domain-containing protein [Rheinheimera mesophila]|nr:PilZ domain-containing protein [Rheinheimera mesophila]
MPYLRQQPGRSYYRWYFYDPQQSLQTQTKGIAVKLKRLGWFGGEIGSAVVKDMSMGGAGLLAPLKDQVPDQFWVLYDKTTKVKARVCYRKTINDKLEFLGLEWQGKDNATRLQLLRKLRRRAFVLKQDNFRLVAVNQQQNLG